MKRKAEDEKDEKDSVSKEASERAAKVQPDNWQCPRCLSWHVGAGFKWSYDHGCHLCLACHDADQKQK